MTCNEVLDLLPGYMLNALESREVEEVDAHLATCREHDDELVDLRATSMALAFLDEAAEPSPHLRERVRAATGPVPLARAVFDPRRAARDGGSDGYDGRRARRSRFPRLVAVPWWFAGVAAAIALVMFGAGWYAGTRAAPAAQQTVRYSYEMRGPSGQLVRFAGIEGSDRVTVTMDGLQAQPEGRQYQVWAIRDGKWVSLGACNTNTRGWWKGDFEFILKQGEEVALTIEPAGGSPKPSTPAVLRTRL
jgi:anti-sigma-K factor RskA